MILTAVMIMSLFTGCSKSSSNESSTTPESPAAAEESSKAEVSSAAEESSQESSQETSQSTEATNNGSSDLPRNETLYIGGMQWGSVNSWNIIGSNQNNIACGYGRPIMFETLYMYNVLNGDILPLLADGDYSWNEDQTELTVKIKSAAHWSDNTPVTAQDVVATWDISTTVGNSIGNTYGAYIESEEAVDDSTLIIHSKVDDKGVPVNPLKVLTYLVYAPVAQKAWIETVKARNNYDPTAILNDVADDVVYS